MTILGGSEMVLIGVATVALLWGPKKIPELARSIGQARSEFDQAAHEEVVDDVGDNH